MGNPTEISTTIQRWGAEKAEGEGKMTGGSAPRDALAFRKGGVKTGPAFGEKSDPAEVLGQREVCTGKGRGWSR